MQMVSLKPHVGRFAGQDESAVSLRAESLEVILVRNDVEFEVICAGTAAKVIGLLVGHLERSGAQLLGAVMPRVAVKVDEIGARCDLDVRHEALEVPAIGMFLISYPHVEVIIHRAVPTGQQVLIFEVVVHLSLVQADLPLVLGPAELLAILDGAGPHVQLVHVLLGELAAVDFDGCRTVIDDDLVDAAPTVESVLPCKGIFVPVAGTNGEVERDAIVVIEVGALLKDHGGIRCAGEAIVVVARDPDVAFLLLEAQGVVQLLELPLPMVIAAFVVAAPLRVETQLGVPVLEACERDGLLACPLHVAVVVGSRPNVEPLALGDADSPSVEAQLEMRFVADVVLVRLAIVANRAPQLRRSHLDGVAYRRAKGEVGGVGGYGGIVVVDGDFFVIIGDLVITVVETYLYLDATLVSA